jgi:hypothetical protein
MSMLPNGFNKAATFICCIVSLSKKNFFYSCSSVESYPSKFDLYISVVISSGGPKVVSVVRFKDSSTVVLSRTISAKGLDGFLVPIGIDFTIVILTVSNVIYFSISGGFLSSLIKVS